MNAAQENLIGIIPGAVPLNKRHVIGRLDAFPSGGVLGSSNPEEQSGYGYSGKCIYCGITFSVAFKQSAPDRAESAFEMQFSHTPCPAPRRPAPPGAGPCAPAGGRAPPARRARPSRTW